MERVIIALLNKNRWSPVNRDEVLSEARSLLSGLPARVNDVRIASKRLEVDAFVDGAIDDLTTRLSGLAPIEYVRRLNRDEVLDEGASIKLGVRYFNDERFWESHEVLEGVWRNKNGAERSVIGGVILVAAAYVNLQKGKGERFHPILKRALTRLTEWQGPTYNIIDVEDLRIKVRRLLNEALYELIEIKTSTT